MESILSMHEEIYPVKTRRNRSTVYSTSSLQSRRSVLNNTNNIFSVFVQFFRKMFAQRTLYILGVLNLILAGIAILCVTQAEDHPEYFALVYIAIAIFVFYMVTILLIIIVQILETYEDQHQRNRLSSTMQTPCLITPVTAPANPLIVESMINKTHAQTRLSRSHTLPLISSAAISPSICKNFHPLKSARFTFLPRNSRVSQHSHLNVLTTSDRYSLS